MKEHIHDAPHDTRQGKKQLAEEPHQPSSKQRPDTKRRQTYQNNESKVCQPQKTKAKEQQDLRTERSKLNNVNEVVKPQARRVKCGQQSDRITIEAATNTSSQQLSKAYTEENYRKGTLETSSKLSEDNAGRPSKNARTPPSPSPGAEPFRSTMRACFLTS